MRSSTNATTVAAAKITGESGWRVGEKVSLRRFLPDQTIASAVLCVCTLVIRDSEEVTVVNVYVIIILSIGNTQINILLLCFLYLFVELLITMNE